MRPEPSVHRWRWKAAGSKLNCAGGGRRGRARPGAPPTAPPWRVSRRKAPGSADGDGRREPAHTWGWRRITASNSAVPSIRLIRSMWWMPQTKAGGACDDGRAWSRPRAVPRGRRGGRRRACRRPSGHDGVEADQAHRAEIGRPLGEMRMVRQARKITQHRLQVLAAVVIAGMSQTGMGSRDSIRFRFSYSAGRPLSVRSPVISTAWAGGRARGPRRWRARSACWSPPSVGGKPCGRT